MTQMQSKAGNHTPEEGYTVDVVDTRLHTDQPDEPGALGGRPADDRALEVVEGGIGGLAGIVIGSAVAAPIGTIVGGIVGILAGLAIGEAFERRMGRVATTTNASEAEAFVPDEAETSPDEALSH